MGKSDPHFLIAWRPRMEVKDGFLGILGDFAQQFSETISLAGKCRKDISILSKGCVEVDFVKATITKRSVREDHWVAD